MTAPTLRYAIATALVASLALAGCKKDKPADTAVTPPPMSTPAPTQPASPMNSAVSITSVTLGTQAGADKMIQTSTTDFTTNDPIIVSVSTTGTSGSTNIHTRLVYDDGQVAGEESQSISANGIETTNFTFNNANGWPAGNYTAEVAIDSAAPRKTSFTVK
ncbi:hypothetical protein [Lysobacter sp. H23M47]|uniref:hypothetical protein n=1 Tax=Lysobacter sp. H23M47 TaxID=2781024 RepID=UPI00187E5C5A|nr:hypothetical protein [Lysobacter sp. H23M47]QOW24520.1 hypothetical protein INQ43_12730 [Lysobacter sp. H23M47]